MITNPQKLAAPVSSFSSSGASLTRASYQNTYVLSRPSQPPYKRKIGTTTSTPVVNGKELLPSDDSSAGNPRFYYPNNLTLILTAPNEEKEVFHSAISTLFYHLMNTSPLQQRQSSTGKIKVIPKQSVALKSRLPTMLILIFTQFQARVEKTETLNWIQILKLEILGLVLGLAFECVEVGLGGDGAQADDEWEVTKVLLLRMAVKTSSVLD